MICKATRKINSSTARQMLCRGDFKFRQRLILKAAERGVRVIVQDETYTSKTRSNCGCMQSVNMVFRCPGCHIRIDRDFNGARDILPRASLDAPSFRFNTLRSFIRCPGIFFVLQVRSISLRQFLSVECIFSLIYY